MVKQTLEEIQQLYQHPKVIIHAQYYARDFYYNLRFQSVGKPFKEAMRKQSKWLSDCNQIT